MCGIAGAINFQKPPKFDLAGMINLIRHRGPNSQNFFSEGPVFFGHARLRVQDLDPIADQPMLNHKKDLCIVFNGEIYNYKDLKKELIEYPFKTHCDTEVILAAYERWGADCVHKFNGMFAFMIYDKKKNIAFGARDRMGVKPFYYSEFDNSFIFASELKSISYVLKNCRPNYKCIAKYIKYDYCEDGIETFFDGIYQLLPGQTVQITQTQKPKFERYYDLRNRPQGKSKIDHSQAKNGLLTLLKSSLSLRVKSDVPVGLYFSGGVDSSALAGMLNKEGVNLQSITAISSDVPKKDIDTIQRMSSEMGLMPIFCTSDENNFSKKFSKWMWHLEMPFSPTIVCDDALNRMAKEKNIVVVLEGQGSDEFQAGYIKYFVPFLKGRLFGIHLFDFIKGLLNPPEPLTPAGVILKLSRDILISILKILNFRGGSKRLDEYILNPDLKYHLNKVQPFEAGMKSSLENLQYIDVYTKLQRVLRCKDRISMAYGRELRVPFLDYRLLEFMWDIPNRMKIVGGVQKKILKDAVNSIVPAESIQRQKNSLLKDRVSKNISGKIRKEALATLELSKRELFDIDKLLRDSQNKVLSEQVIWRFSQVELWFKVFIDNSIEQSKHLKLT